MAIVVAALSLTACSNDEPTDITTINKQTVLVYMPWSGSQSSPGLYDAFLENLDSIEGAVKRAKGYSGRLLVFISKSATTSDLYEITYNNGEIVHTPIKTYSGNGYTTSAGITEILNDVKSAAYALNYAMMVGCHGSGWTYKSDWADYPDQAKSQPFFTPGEAQSKRSPDSNGTVERYPATRFFGSVADTNYATDVTTLAEGIRGAGLTMQFISFDDCYMANVETAYELRNVTNYLIGSTSEVMFLGMPYQTMWPQLASPTPSYAKAVTAFYDFYKSYTYPYGALSAIDCREVEQLARIMKTINSRFTLTDTLADSVQVLDGFKVPLFFDMGDYVDRLCTNTTLLSDFHSQLNKVVKAKSYTETLYSFLYTRPVYIKVKKYSGLTISDPSTHPVALKGRQKTGWWQATH